MYVVHGDDETGYNVGFFPGAGPECEWKKGFTTVDEAMLSAEECIEHVKSWRKELGYDE